MIHATCSRGQAGLPPYKRDSFRPDDHLELIEDVATSATIRTNLLQPGTLCRYICVFNIITIIFINIIILYINIYNDYNQWPLHQPIELPL